MSKGVIHRNENIMPIETQAFLDDTLSTEAKGVLITLMVNNKCATDAYVQKYSVQLDELESKGYLVRRGDDVTLSATVIGEKRKQKNYKHILSDALGITWNSRIYEVHHINHDRSDNRVENLLLLQKILHRLYHSCYRECSVPCYVGNLLNKKIDLMQTSLHDSVILLAACKSDMANILKAQKMVLYGPDKKSAVKFYEDILVDTIKHYMQYGI